MEYASKNVMLNIHSIFKQIIKTIQTSKELTEHIDIKDLETKLVIDIDKILNNILINLADNYPQAPPTGGTLKMR